MTTPEINLKPAPQKGIEELQKAANKLATSILASKAKTAKAAYAEIVNPEEYSLTEFARIWTMVKSSPANYATPEPTPPKKPAKKRATKKKAT